MAVPIAFQPLVRYADFQGRARRSEYWLFWLMQFIFFSVINAVLMAFMFQSFSATTSDPASVANMAFNPVLLIVGQLSNIAGLALLVPNIAVGVRRLHDSNRSGWWLVMPAGVFVAGMILFLMFNGATLISSFANADSNPDALFNIMGQGFLLIWLPTIIASLVLFVFNLLDGTPGMNRFGADPKGRGVTADVERAFT